MLPLKYERHYCRECDLEIPTGERHQSPPHFQIWLHRLQVHRIKDDYKRCSRSCELRAQPEEITGEKRLYGKGIPRPEIETINRYELLFPRDNV